ncbi:hypothetical protein [Nocardia abscessus]|uniref:hypothetical protein n=1 Tax=Nocardia abscessus TaxID=120957 RepID=UPI000306EB06|nr:hypothetical protein [Nocardia abscessus]MCC3333552.1 hypothetical protein [Nocardia abscessus]
MTDSITNKHGTEIRVGQVWADNDPRSEGRTLKVVAIEMGFVRRAVCEPVTEIGGKPAKPGRTVRIKVDRMWPTSTGYRLVSEGGEAL